MKAKEICFAAANLVGGDRESQHGPKEINHENIAKLWQAFLEIRQDPAAPLRPLDAALMLALLKIARTQLGSHNIDDYVDLAGYAAVAGEIASNGEA